MDWLLGNGSYGKLTERSIFFCLCPGIFLVQTAKRHVNMSNMSKKRIKEQKFGEINQREIHKTNTFGKSLSFLSSLLLIEILSVSGRGNNCFLFLHIGLRATSSFEWSLRSWTHIGIHKHARATKPYLSND